MGALPRTEKGLNYLFVAIDKFNKMKIIVACKKTIKVQ